MRVKGGRHRRGSYRRGGVMMLVIMILLSALAGCGADWQNDEEDEDAVKGLSIEKVDRNGIQQWMIEGAQARDFMERWLTFSRADRYEEVNTEGLIPQCTYHIYADKTILAGQSESSGQRKVMQIILYEDTNMITEQITAGDAADIASPWLDDLLTFHVMIEEETAAYLKEYAAEEANESRGAA